MRLLLVVLLVAVVVADEIPEFETFPIACPASKYISDESATNSIFGDAIYKHAIESGLGETHCALGKCGPTCDGVLTESGCDEHEGPRADLLPPFSQGDCAAFLEPEIKNEWITPECAPGKCGPTCDDDCNDFELGRCEWCGRDFPIIEEPQPMDRVIEMEGNCC
jgi:hypothetical protein